MGGRLRNSGWAVGYRMGGASWKRFLAFGLGGVGLCALSRDDSQAAVGAAVQVASISAVVLAVRTWKPEHWRAW